VCDHLGQDNYLISAATVLPEACLTFVEEAFTFESQSMQ